MKFNVILAGWWYTYPFENYESQLGSFFPIEWKNQRHVPTTNQITIIFPFLLVYSL